ncbi:hypothetical protein SAMN05216548_102199 [Faunimonas pinastri]|uniref:Secreted protein n=1 Tax=Faunimonas pinastri TaxID=1855383 RepID=A0A1H9CN02_9HYPH|nr:hypothetical protein [Faunimonas pinastri]SEQ02544.1 hypothetical protein SAMN05216548_102199 [Faunimonas pinastri]
MRIRVATLLLSLCLYPVAGATGWGAQPAPFVPHHAKADEPQVKKGIDLFCERHLFSDNPETKRRCVDAELSSWSVLMTLAGSSTAKVLSLPALRRCAQIPDEDVADFAVDWRRALSCWND